MGKKYDAYEKAAQAENESRGRLEFEKVIGNEDTIYQAGNDYAQNVAISDATFQEMIEDPEG